MFNIDWHQLDKNAEGAPQDFFEKFNYQIAVKKYATLGTFEYDYDTPGSEFYLSLTSDSEELNAKAGDDIGWQAKFWRGKKDDEHSPFDNNELIINFKKSLEYKPNLMVWIICTPGQPSNKKPHLVRDSLEKKLKAIKPDIVIHYWNKPNYEAIFHSESEKFASIFNHYFSTQYLSFNLFESHSKGRLDILKEKRYFSNLYTHSKADRRILSSIIYADPLNDLQDKIKHAIYNREELIGSYLYRKVINKFLTLNKESDISRENKEMIFKVKTLIDEILALHEQFHIYKEQENTLKFTKHLLNMMESKRDNIIKLIDEVDFDDRYYNDIYIDYNSDVESVNQLINDLHAIANNWLDTTVKIYRLLAHASRQVFHIVGEAGFGKTNFACHITEQLLEKKLPVLLIPASEITGPGNTITYIPLVRNP